MRVSVFSHFFLGQAPASHQWRPAPLGGVPDRHTPQPHTNDDRSPWRGRLIATFTVKVKMAHGLAVAAVVSPLGARRPSSGPE
jgi:hypothetical protein